MLLGFSLVATESGLSVVVNIHERAYEAPVSEVAALLATLASKDDRLWPYECWPRMRFDRGLVPGASGDEVHHHVPGQPSSPVSRNDCVEAIVADDDASSR